MIGFRALLRKEFRETLRTWRIWVLPSVLVFFALTGPPTARYTREILTSALGDQAGMIPMPDPTYLDSYAQWTKNLAQIVLFVLIVMLGGVIAGERRQGTAVLVLTKPVTRAAFVLAKALSSTILVVASTIVATVLTWLVTVALFPEAPLGALAAATGSWLLLAILFVAIMVLASCVADATAGAAGLGFLGFIVLALAGIWGPAARYTPAGLMGIPGQYAAGSQPEVLWPAVTTVGLTIVVLLLAIGVFRRREL